jgi:hypothetical protein
MEKGYISNNISPWNPHTSAIQAIYVFSLFMQAETSSFKKNLILGNTVKTSVTVLSPAKPFLDYTPTLLRHSCKHWPLQTVLEPSKQERRRENLRQNN